MFEFLDNLFSCSAGRKHNVYTSEPTINLTNDAKEAMDYKVIETSQSLNRPSRSTLNDSLSSSSKCTHVLIDLKLGSKKHFDVCVKVPYTILELNMHDIMALTQYCIRMDKQCINTDMIDFFVYNSDVETILGDRNLWDNFNLRDVIIKCSNQKIIPKSSSEHIFKFTVHPKYTTDTFKISLVPKQQSIELECIGVKNRCEECWFCRENMICRNFLFFSNKNLGTFFLNFSVCESEKILVWKNSPRFAEPLYINIK